MATYSRLNSSKKLVIVGGTPDHSYRSELTTMAEKDPRIILTGPLYGQGVRELFAGAYLFVLPSSIEGLSISLLEEMSLGTASPVSDIPANLEVLETGGVKTGFSFRNGDFEDLYEPLCYLVSSQEEVRRVGLLGKMAVTKKYNWDRITEAFLDVYSRITNRRRDVVLENKETTAESNNPVNA